MSLILSGSARLPGIGAHTQMAAGIPSENTSGGSGNEYAVPAT
jgi:hypothetical protein